MSRLNKAFARMLSHFSHVWFFATLWTIAHQVPPSWDFPSKNTGVGCHALLQWISPTQESNVRLLWLLNCRWILLPLSHQGRPTMPLLGNYSEPGSVQFFSYIFFNLQNDHKSGELLSWLDKTKIMRLKEANWVLTERGPLGRPHRFKCPRAHIVFIRTHRITPLVKELGVLQAWPKNTWSENIRLTGVDREVFWLCVSRQQSPKTTSGSWGWKPATDSEDRSRGRHHEQRS